MVVLLVTINYPPEIGGAPHLIHQLSLGLKARGHDVSVLTGYPRYNISSIPSRYRQGLIMDETVDEIPVRRIRIPQMPRESKIARGLQHFIFGLELSLLTGLSHQADVALVFSPPLPLPWLTCMVGRLRRIPVVVNIQDLFPKQAVELGMLSNSLLIRLFEAMENHVHRLAAGVLVHSPGNLKHVVKKGGDQDRVHIVYNWVDTEHIQPGHRNNKFALRHGIAKHFVVSYAGTMGWAQDMDTIISCANHLRNYRDIFFLLVGDGVEKKKAQNRSRELGLTNILWLPIQPWSVYPDILATSDISMINLHPDLRTPVVPSKLLSIMAAGRPVVASLPAESDARQIIADAGCGIYVDAGDGKSLAEAIQTLYSDYQLIDDMGRRGRDYVETNFSRKVCVNRVENILQTISGGIP